jgi:hypothetical protein
MFLDHKEIQIAVLTRISTRVRSKEQNARGGTRRRSQPSSCIHNDCLAYHGLYAIG